jgi:multicomponent Na+:H+ antiporter subunit F
MTLISVLFLIAGILFAVAAVFVLYRIVVGPSILDRMIASDVLLTTLILVVGAEMVYNGHTRTIPVMLVLASTAVFATVAVARYVSKQDKLAPDAFTAPAPQTVSEAARDELEADETATSKTTTAETATDETTTDETLTDKVITDEAVNGEAVTEKNV